MASVLGSTFTLLASTLKAGWAREVGGVQILVTRAPVAMLNGVLALREECDAAQVQAGLEDVSSEGVPYCLECRASWAEAGEAIAVGSGLLSAPDIPLMASAGPVWLPPAAELSVRQLGPGEARLHCEVAAPAFGASSDLFAQIFTDKLLERGEVTAYVGDADGEHVVTAMSVQIGDAVGIFNVATPEAHRRRGYGAAITAQAVGDGFRRGASYAWLQSSEAGAGVYERLGFKTLERWPCWVSTG